MALSIKREVFNKTSIINVAVDASATIWDLDLTSLSEEDATVFAVKLQTSPKVLFAWVKGTKLTLWLSNAADAPKWNDLLVELGIAAKVGPKLAKRLARAFSPRDVVLELDDVNVEIIPGNEYTRYPEITNEDDIDALIDGTIAIRKGFVIDMMHAAGRKVSELRHAEALSMSMIYSGGFIKALAYIVEDEIFPSGVDILTGSANIKSDLSSSRIWMSFDIFHPYGQPKSNAQMDPMLGRMLMHTPTDVANLNDVLKGDFDKIVSGTAVKSLDDWNLGDLSKRATSTKVNEDFAALNDMTADMAARGLDYRWFPGLLSMLATAATAQWWSTKKKWAYYPLMCSMARPIISESAACLIGEEVDVERGEIRAIRDGEIWVVNDLDYIEFFRLNTGGSDLDDHFVLLFRMINGVKSVFICRNPMGWREFQVLKFVEGDPFPTHTYSDGTEISFPVLPGKLTKNLYESGNTFSGLGEFEPAAYPLVYGPDAVIPTMKEMAGGEAGNVGSIINTITLAAGTNPALLENMPAAMETIIDSFTQGGGLAVRGAMIGWSDGLKAQLQTLPEVDKVLWKRRSNGDSFDGGDRNLVNGWFSVRNDANVAARTKLRNSVSKFSQEMAEQGNPLLEQLEQIFGVARADVKSTTNELMATAVGLEAGFRASIVEMNRMPAEDRNWAELYEAYVNRIMISADHNVERASMLSVACWYAAMSVKTTFSKEYSDRGHINAKMWPLFIQGLVKLGLAMDLNKMGITVAWNLTCSSCNKTGVVTNPRNYVIHVHNNFKCKTCA